MARWLTWMFTTRFGHPNAKFEVPSHPSGAQALNPATLVQTGGVQYTFYFFSAPGGPGSFSIYSAWC